MIDLLPLLGVVIALLVAHSHLGLGWGKSFLAGLGAFVLYLVGATAFSGFLGDESTSDGAAFAAIILIVAASIVVALFVTSYLSRPKGTPVHR